MVSSEERGAVVAWHRRKLPFWPNASLFGHRDFVPPTQERKSLMCEMAKFSSGRYAGVLLTRATHSATRLHLVCQHAWGRAPILLPKPNR